MKHYIIIFLFMIGCFAMIQKLFESLKPNQESNLQQMDPIERAYRLDQFRKEEETLNRDEAMRLNRLEKNPND